MAAVVTVALILLLAIGNLAYAKRFGSTLCNEDPTKFSCYTVKKGDSWKKLFPDEQERDVVMKINRMNTQLHSGNKIAMPHHLSSDPLNFAPFPLQIDPPGEKVIIVSLKDLAFGAYSPDGTLIRWGPISSGKGYCPDVGRRCGTPSGKFAIRSKQGPGCISHKFPVGRGGAPMPYCMFFHGGYALHGSYEVPGYHASHGCVRLFVNDAKWLNQEFADYGTRVIIRR